MMLLDSAERTLPSRVATSPEELTDAVDGWRALAASGGASYFATPDWVLSWWETVGRGTPGEVALWEDGSGALEAVVPLARVRRRVHSRLPWRFSAWTNLGGGVGSADHCGWAVAERRFEDVSAWLAQRAARTSMFLWNQDPSTGVPYVPSSARMLYGTACPRLVIDPGQATVGRSRKSRNRIRHYLRELTDRGVAFRWVPPEEMSDGTLEALFDLHGKRQAMKGRESSFDSTTREFHRRMVARSGPGRGPAAAVAECDGRPIGIRYGFLWGDVLYEYQGGWEPEWAPYRFGTVLHAQAISLAGGAGIRIYDFLRGDEDYKYRFGAVDRVDETWLAARGLAARVFALKYRMRARGGRRQHPVTASETEA